MTSIALVIAPKSCKKCDACKLIVDEIARDFAGRVAVSIFDTNAPEATKYGVVLPPTMVVDDFIVAVGSVPRKAAVMELVAQRVNAAGQQSPAGEIVPVLAAEFDESLGCEPMLLFWYVEEGDTVAEGQDLCEIESAKAVFVIQSPAAGRLVRIQVREGDAVLSGATLGEVERAGA
jgi:biotin carboxyl carrier protein